MTSLTEEQLRQEAIKAATHYVKVKSGGTITPDHWERVNACAAGFFMGVRWLENQIKEKNQSYSEAKGDWL